MTEAPCNYCGAEVQIVGKEVPPAIGGGRRFKSFRDERVCTDMECPSNNGRRSLGKPV